MTRDSNLDRRVRRTRRRLHEALASLIHEKSYDDIAVKEILGRADVGRSTFYAHFRDKDALLGSGVRDMLRAGGTPPPRRSVRPADHVLRFSLALFEHIAQSRDANPATVPEHLTVVHDRLERGLAEFLFDELARIGPRGLHADPDVPLELLAQHVAATFLVVLRWWLARRDPVPVQTANALFRSLVHPALTETLG